MKMKSEIRKSKSESNPDAAIPEGTRREHRDLGHCLGLRTSGFGYLALLVCSFTFGAEAPEYSFRNHVQPILAKFGCSSGACHGAAAGKNGFGISLRGYDDEGDWRALTRGALGRRVIPSDPSSSLLLTKPTGAAPHKGGVKFEADSLEFRVLSRWIAAGAPGPGRSDPRIESIELRPAHAVLKKDATQQMKVLARFSDGGVQDVTRWAKYTSADTTVANVDDKDRSGLVTVTGNGEGAITAWYLSKIAIATVTSPYSNKVDPGIFSESERRNFIDEIVLEKLSELNLPPSPAAGDAEFIRRACLDTIGILPTAAQTRRFLEDGSAGKRAALIDALLNREEWVDYWSYKWSDLLLVSSRKLSVEAMWSYYHWIRDQVAANAGWDEMVRRLVTASGNALDNGAANFHVLHNEPRQAAETITAAFMGFSVNCAKCHNHPMEKWTNDQYYGLANMLSRVRLKAGVSGGAGPRGGLPAQVVFAASEGELIQPLTGKPQPPRPLDGQPLDFDSPVDRRVALAQWLTSPDNLYFTRSIVNRVWANFMGVGLVDKVDDMRKTNPASNEKLMAALCAHLVKNRYDLKSLMRVILDSAAYQRSSRPLPGNAADRRFYSRYYPRRVMAEALLDSISQVTAAPTMFNSSPGNRTNKVAFNFPKGWRAIQLPDSNVASYFLESFGRADREATCECERTAEPSMAQALHIANGETVNDKLKARDNRLDQVIAAKMTDAQIVDDLFLAALCRPPAAGEKSRLLEILAQAPADQRRAALEDLYWSVLSSKEFLFNH